MSYVRFNQNDIEWKNVPYPKGSQIHTIGNAGSGPTAIAILVSDIIPTIDPEIVATWLSKHGFGTMGTAWKGIKLALQHYGYEDIKQHSDHTCYNKIETIAELSWRNAVQNNLIGMLEMGKSLWTDSSCYIVVLKAKFDQGIEYYYVIDPQNENSGWFSWKDFSGKVKNFFSCSPRRLLEIDGQWGTETTTFLQRALHTTEDGIISEQDERLREFVPAGAEVTFSWIKHPIEQSRVISKLQMILDVPVDGSFGRTTIEALQKKLNLQETGFCDLITVKALQLWINSMLKEERENDKN